MAPYLDDALRKTGRIETRSSRNPEDSGNSGEVESQPFEEGTRVERALVGDILRGHRREVTVADQIAMIGVCSEDTLLSTICWQAWIGPHW